MNESLEGHTGEIACITWNNLFNKLTPADSNGKIVVWVNFEGILLQFNLSCKAYFQTLVKKKHSNKANGVKKW